MTRHSKSFFAATLALLALLPFSARADYVVKDGNGTLQTIHAFNCSATICPASVPIDSTGAALGVTGNPFFVTFSSAPTVNLGTLNGAATAANQASVIGTAGAGAAATNSLLTGGVYNSSPITLTTAQQSALQLDANGYLKVSIATGGGSGGTSSTFGASFPATGTAVGMTQGGLMVALSGTSGNLNVQCANCSGSGVSTADGATFTAGSSLFVGVGGVFQTTVTSNPLTAGHQGFAQLTAFRAVMNNARDSAGGEIIGTTTQAHTCSTAGYTVIGCLGQLDDDMKGPITTQVSTVSIGGVGLFSGGAIMSATNGIYSNLLQGNAVLSATNGTFANVLQGNAALSQSNPLPSAEQLGTAYPNNGNWRRGAASATTTTATTIIAAPVSNSLYVRSVHCSRDDAGTSAMRVTLNDDVTTTILLPNNGGGGANNVNYDPPLKVSATTALQFTASAAITTVRCNAQAYVAP